jgi:transcription elongation factor GreA
MANNTQIRMTAAAHSRLSEELEHLLTVERPAALDAIADARTDSVNVGESGTHQSALEAKDHLDNRIADIRARLSRADVVDVVDTSRVDAGCVAHVRFDDGEVESFVVDVAAPPDAVAVSPGSPMGVALLGAAAGDTITWTSPTGQMSATVVEITAE